MSHRAPGEEIGGCRSGGARVSKKERIGLAVIELLGWISGLQDGIDSRVRGFVFEPVMRLRFSTILFKVTCPGAQRNLQTTIHRTPRLHRLHALASNASWRQGKPKAEPERP